MTNAQVLTNRFSEVLLDGKWIANTNYNEQLHSITWEQAIQKIGSLNTIALLTFHINYYLEGVLQVFEGGTLDIRDKYSFDMQPITKKEDWETLLETIISNAEKFKKHIEVMSDEKLQSVFVDEKYGTYQKNIEGMIEHSYYHLGQISLIKKLVLETTEIK